MNDERRSDLFENEPFADEARVAVPAAETQTPVVLRAVPTQPDERDLPRIRAELGARVHDCWDRLDDVVSELVALHEIRGDEIIRRVRETVAAEAPDAG